MVLSSAMKQPPLCRQEDTRPDVVKRLLGRWERSFKPLLHEMDALHPVERHRRPPFNQCRSSPAGTAFIADRKPSRRVVPALALHLTRQRSISNRRSQRSAYFTLTTCTDMHAHLKPLQEVNVKSPLHKLFHPAAIAVVGASQNVSSISGQPLKNLKTTGYRGRLYPVNPKYREVLGERCYRDVADLPETPHLAIIVVAAPNVPDALAACGRKGIPFALVVSSGFAETGVEGTIAQRQIVEIAHRHNLRVVGPNCQGLMNVTDDLGAGFGAPFAMSFRKGPISLVSQSGAFGCAILMMAEDEGLGFRHFVSSGNEADITALELIDHFCDDEETRIIGAYVEGFKDASRLEEVSRKALTYRKPLLVWKVGNTAAGATAVASHTANLAGSYALYQAVFRKNGVIEVSDVADLVDCASAFIPGRLPRGNRIALVTMSGGAGIAMADYCVEAGMQLPLPSDESLALIRATVPFFAALGNPLDITAGIIDNPRMLERALTTIVSDPNFDSIAVACAGLSGEVALGLAEAVVATYQRTDKPILLAWNARADAAREAYALVDRYGVPRFRTPVRCARAAKAITEYANAVRRFESSRTESVVTIHRPDVRTALHGRRTWLTECEGKHVLRQYGISITRERLANSRAEAVRIADELGYPVVMKVQSVDIPHKTECGGVRLAIREGQAVVEAWDEMMSRLKETAPDARIDGVLVQEHIEGATEVIVGVKNDPAFGPAVMFGLGGIFVEVLRDVAFRLAPVTFSEALQMIGEIDGFPILDGARGRPKADLEALADTLVRLSALTVDLRTEIREVEINPLFVLPAGQGVKAGDALIGLVDQRVAQ